MAKKKQGDGSVFQRKDGRWEGRIVVGYKENGYAKTKNVTAHTKTECQEKLAKLREECGRTERENQAGHAASATGLTSGIRIIPRPSSARPHRRAIREGFIRTSSRLSATFR